MSFTSKIALVALLLGAASVSAAPMDEEGAREHFELGRRAYRLGNYEEAIREFSAGYKLAPRPQFLLNLGQCYRKLNDLSKAREMYRSYLTDTPAQDPERADVQKLIDDIDRTLAKNLAPATGSTPTIVSPPPQPPRRSFARRHWWIFPVTAAVLAGIGVGIYYGVRPSEMSCASASLGCIMPVR